MKIGEHVRVDEEIYATTLPIEAFVASIEKLII